MPSANPPPVLRFLAWWQRRKTICAYCNLVPRTPAFGIYCSPQCRDDDFDNLAET